MLSPPVLSTVVLARASALLVVLACSAGCHRSSPSASSSVAAPKSAPAAENPLEKDDRVAYLLAPCPLPEAFVYDTSDMIPVLVSKLETGHRDPQKVAKAELAAIGDPAMPELRRAFDKAFQDRNGEPCLLNILTVASLTSTDSGRVILLRGLEHPAEAVRMSAVRGLKRHPRPEDYDRLRDLLPISTADMQVLIASALAACDKKRLEDDYVAQPTDDRLRAFQRSVVFQISDTKRPDVIAIFVRAYPTAEPETQAFMAAAAARMGNGEAHSVILAWLKDESTERRQLAVQAMIRAGLVAELAPRLREEKEDAIREGVAAAIAELAPTAETRGWLSAGLSDRSRNVRMTCLLALVKQKDAAAENAALELLKGDSIDLANGLRALRDAWKTDAALAERALSILVRLRAREIEPVRVGPAALDRAIAQVPLEAAARYLYELAQKTPGEVDGLPAHRWYLQQAGNTGEAGWSYLSSRWDEEQDPARRMDLVMACSYELSSERTLEFLIRVAESERSTPIEVLYAADFLVHRGPADRVAPLLKRLTLRIEDPNVRRALNCMLGEWYGPGP
jgi:hypothetical protein